MKAFFDTSAFVKKYVSEKGSEQVIELLGQTTSLGLSILAIPECLSSLVRLRRQRKLTGKQYQQLKESFLADIVDVSLCGITQNVIQRAITLLESHPIKTLDVLHVASALEWHAECFVSADVQQTAAAKHHNPLKVILIS